MWIMSCCFLDIGQWPIQRCLAESERLLGSKNCKGYKCQPLLHVEPTSCPPDHLHMRKGIISKLLNQVFTRNNLYI